MKELKIIFFIAVLVTNAYPQDAKISGKITDSNNKPLFGANVVIEGTIEGATADSAGIFEFETSLTGKYTLIITAIDYKEKRQGINLESAKTIEVSVKLSKSEVVTDEILVTASSYTSGEHSKVTLTPLEIVRIPGADADLYRALTTFPGSNQVDEGSRLTVRGGDASEVLTILDQASLYHPFIFDNDFNSSSYSTVNPWGLRGINFSSGGFSAKFGNVLSAVLDLKTYEVPQGTGAFLFFGLANASASGVFLSNDKKLGATFDIYSTFLEPYFKINGRLGADYSPIPVARGIGGTLSYKLSQKTYLKYYADYNYDKVGIRNTSPSYDGYYNSQTKTYFTNLKFSTGFSPTSFLNAGLSYSNHTKDVKYGILDNAAKDIYSKLRIDFTKQLSKKVDLNAGAEYEYNEGKFNGTVPQYSYNLRSDAPAFEINSKTITGRVGGYLETQLKLSKKFFIIAGLRTDYHTLSKNANFDPRISLGFNIAKDNVIRAAAGLYHQYPALQYYAQSFDKKLKPEQAVHYILGYELNKMNGLLLFRVEAYYKDYKNLVLFDSTNFLYNSNGSGDAKGVDVFLKSKITNKYSAWISYAYTDSKRKQYEAVEKTSADYDITHSLTTVASYNVTDNLVVGMTYRISTGKPYTPINDGIFDSTQNVYIPVYGLKNSDRFPTYQRVDVNAQYIFSLFGKFAVGVFALNNVFNQRNLYDYTYNFDYSRKLEIISTNRRTVYFALGIGL
ncbi:MAG: TonB-dependent receptor [Ignavibacteria bacterium]